METKDVILELRTKKGLSQDELAEKVYVTRQAVSRWENGETIPNTETLKLLSGFFDVSINTLLGSPRQLICQCCGMPLDDSTISKEPDGTFNEEYCKWCYTDGKFTYDSIDDLIAFCVEHMLFIPWTILPLRTFDWALESPVAEIMVYSYAAFMIFSGIFSILSYTKGKVKSKLMQVCVVINSIYAVGAIAIIGMNIVTRIGG